MKITIREDCLFISSPHLATGYLFKRSVYFSCCILFLFPPEADTKHNLLIKSQHWISLNLLAGHLVILIFHLITRAHFGNHHLVFWMPHRHHVITCFCGDLFCFWWKWLSRKGRVACLSVWGVCGRKAAVKCIDKKPRATIRAGSAQYKGWPIDCDPRVMQAEDHKHTNTQLYLCCASRRGVRRLWFNPNNDFQFIFLSLLQCSPLCLVLIAVVSIRSPEWVTGSFINQFSQIEKSQSWGWIQGPSVGQHTCRQWLAVHCLIFLFHHLYF